MRVVADFRSDWSALQREEIRYRGHKIEENWDDIAISDVFFSLRHRSIEVRPREVFTAREFRCPDRYNPGLELMEGKARKGESLCPYLSTRITDASFNDLLLNDWGIHHLHLGASYVEGRFVERTEHVLFVIATDEALFKLDVLAHQPTPWTCKRLISIIHCNWPELIAACRIVDAVGVESIPSEREAGALRKAGINSMLQMEDGTIYVPPGGALTTSGQSVDVVQNSNRLFRLVDRLERYVRQHGPAHVARPSFAQPTHNIELHFRLRRIQSESVTILEQNTGARFTLPIGSSM